MTEPRNVGRPPASRAALRWIMNELRYGKPRRDARIRTDGDACREKCSDLDCYIYLDRQDAQTLNSATIAAWSLGQSGGQSGIEGKAQHHSRRLTRAFEANR
jgi:hypothetical protein